MACFIISLMYIPSAKNAFLSLLNFKFLLKLEIFLLHIWYCALLEKN